MWAHAPPKDIEPDAPPVLYWFQQSRDARGEPTFVPRFIDDHSGVGVQVTVADVTGDDRPDILTVSKLGTFVFRNEGPPKKKAVAVILLAGSRGRVFNEGRNRSCPHSRLGQVMFARFALLRALLRTAVVVSAVLPAVAAGAESPSFESHVRPLLAKYCFECHGGETPEAGLRLDQLADGVRRSGGRASGSGSASAWNSARCRPIRTRGRPPQKRAC